MSMNTAAEKNIDRNVLKRVRADALSVGCVYFASFSRNAAGQTMFP